MILSIVTPSHRQLAWLRLCAASVTDQGEGVEHVVQDALSDDGTREWLAAHPAIKAVSEADAGMYDALNRGLRRATGEILGHLNCDEQYLPGALAAVRQYFQQHPEIDVVFADALVVNGEGHCLCHRKVVLPQAAHTWACHLGTLTCATFFRRRVLTEKGLWFNPGFKSVGDAEWVLRLLSSGAKLGVLRQFTSAFTITGDNLSLDHPAAEEWQRLRPWPAWLRLARPFLKVQHRLRRAWHGAYSHPPFHYGLYTKASPEQRQDFAVEHPTGRWQGW